MSLELSDVAVKAFEKEVQHEFQAVVADIKPLVRVKDAKGKKQVQFNLMGKGQATERTNYHTDIPIMNITHDPKVATVSNWTASDYTDIFLGNQVDFDEKQALVMTVNLALKRRMLQILIDILDAASITKTVADDISGSADDLVLAGLRAASILLSKDGVDKMGRTYMGHTTGIHHLTSDDRVASTDYTNKQVLPTGEIQGYYGFKFYEVPDMDEGGLPVPSTDHRTSWAFHKNAIGLAINMEPRVEITYDGNKGAHRVTGFLSAGAVLIDTKGVVEFTTDESNTV